MKHWCVALLLLIPAHAAVAQQGDGTDVKYPVSVFKPNKVAATTERINQLKTPEGFKVDAFASGLGNSRILVVSEDGTVYVSRREEGDVLMLKDEDGDGKADRGPVVVANRPQTHGLAIHNGKLYIITFLAQTLLRLNQANLPRRMVRAVLSSQSLT